MHPREFCSPLRTFPGCSSVFLKHQIIIIIVIIIIIIIICLVMSATVQNFVLLIWIPSGLLVPNRNHSCCHGVARVDVVSRGTVLQDERTQVRFPIMLLGMRDQKVTGDDHIPGDVLKLLGEDGVRRVTQLIKTYMKLENVSKISLKLQRVKSYTIQRLSHNQSYFNYRKYSSEGT